MLGRISSSVAKLLMQGHEVVLINAEKTLITGHERDILEKYKRKIELRDKANPEHSPHISRRPDLFVKRVIRGMLPYKKPKGKEAFRKLRVYMGAAKDIKDAKAHDLKPKMALEAYENAMTVMEVSQKLGYKA